MIAASSTVLQLLSLGALAALASAAGFVVFKASPALLISVGAALTPFAGNWGALGLPGGVAPDRTLLVAGILTVWFKSGGLARPRLEPVHWLMAAASGFVAVSALISHTLSQSSSFFRFVDAFGILPFALFLVAPTAFATRRARSLLSAALVILGAYLSLTAIFEIAHLDALVWPRYILDPTYGDPGELGRVRGPFAAAVQNGFGLFFCGIAATVGAAEWKSRAARSGALIVALACFATTFSTQQRSVWVGAIVAAVVVVIAAGDARSRVLPVMVGVVLTILLLVALFPSVAANATRRKNDVEPVWERNNMAVAGLNMIEAKPLLGFGWGTFQSKSEPYFQQSSNYPLVGTHTLEHNTYLSYGAELGLVGAGLWMLTFAIGIGSAAIRPRRGQLRAWRQAVLPMAAFYTVVVYFVPPPTGFPPEVLWLVAGVARGRNIQATPETLDDA